ncbi:MAG: hypothetical protein LJE67_01790 [Salaquimonas sp.]|nr:hypothetical protein [Salaquimonas sp.]
MAQQKKAFSAVSPRMRGIAEHFERAEFFLGLARDQVDDRAKYRLMLAAIYSCRAITELMLEAAEKQEVGNSYDSNLNADRKALEEQIAPMLPYYFLIERIRIHDFHRFGILPPDHELKEMFFGGPVELIAQNGAATVALRPERPEYITNGNSWVQGQRPLLNQDGLFFDDDSSKCVTLHEILETFLAKAPDAISAFAERLKGKVEVAE